MSSLFPTNWKILFLPVFLIISSLFLACGPMPPQVSVEGEMTEIDSVEPQNLAEETPEAIVRQALARPKIELTGRYYV